MDARGGHGCLREFLEAILKARGQWEALLAGIGAALP
jgi:3-deoxy-D-manno-octulosonate 8-phosphate phosphatase KdsC-like HAD superfamily phosphatase